MKKISIVLYLFLCMFLIGCTSSSIPVADNTDKPIEGNINEEKPDENNLPAIENNQIDYEKIKPNENGQVMILMYHGIGEEEAEWIRTPENFKKDLQTLYDNGYRVISLRDYIENKIDVEAGFTPVVITFDDGLLNQFNLLDSGDGMKIDPDCAVGLLENFSEKYPDFGKAASFFIYYPIPFRQKDLIKEKYEFLINHGYEIGNHGYNHENLGKINIEEVQKSLSKNVMKTKEILPDYEVQSLALPYGAAPKGEDYKYVVSGNYEGFSYDHKAVLLVGSNPAPSPNSIKFNPQRLPRVRGSEMLVAGTGLYDYIKYFEKNPHKKYISDGDTNTITIPESEIDNIDKDRLVNKKVITYHLQNDNKPDES
ncbi:MAG: polysaccharide deacetylase family protein [Lutispora sp.]|nr:polysaccharide deacetylase family protein [Lutispora sp.]MDD4833912.1 polysaccharide deacetylase family protein [Lutispora sp.]